MSDLEERISIDPEIMAGKAVIRGTRIPVELVVRMIAQGTCHYCASALLRGNPPNFLLSSMASRSGRRSASP